MFLNCSNKILIYKINFQIIKYANNLKKRYLYNSTQKIQGCKRQEVSSESLLPAYNAGEVESIWYDWWEKQNYFKPTKSEVDSYVILLPPPNISGTLHLGHVLTASIQDIIVRWKRMKGHSVLWIPGLDHAGIATQVVVEKYLQKSLGLSTQNLGKEEFIKRACSWKEDKENIICDQLKKIGASLDWSRLMYTLDPAHSYNTTKAFITLFNDKLIYRNIGLVNWSCTLGTSISDIEVDFIHVKKKTALQVPGYEKPIEFGALYKFAYKIFDENDEIIVSTTRPETMLGDVAIAVHPEDERYSKFAGKMVWHPFRLEKIPIIFDKCVDQSLGTGAVKITPFHSLQDFEIGVKYNLKGINVINEKGLINKIGINDKFHGLKRFDARKIIIDELKNLGLFKEIQDHSMKIPICSRTHDVIEYLPKNQWFLKCDTLEEKALNLVKNGQLKLFPENFKNVWFDWLSNNKDWNLSRQLWWGHQIPMYECAFDEQKIWIPALNLDEAKIKGSKSLRIPIEKINVSQDSDVLDTWFSSSLVPITAMSNSSRAQINRPITSLLVTGHDIIFFWVARMVMLCYHLTGKLPFNEVFLHSLVCDSNGKKMSKSVGNVILPEDVINGRSLDEMSADVTRNCQEGLIKREELKIILKTQKEMFPQGIPKCGADALRFSLCFQNFKSSLIKFDVALCEMSIHFCNKIWQATKYFIKVTDKYIQTIDGNYFPDFSKEKLLLQNFNTFDKWILSRLAATVDIVNQSIETYSFVTAVSVLKYFVKEEFCSVYLESSKIFLKNFSKDESEKIILLCLYCLETSLKLLSPFMPFVSEHLYQSLPSLKGFKRDESIMISSFPETTEWEKYRDINLENQMTQTSKLITQLLNIQVSYKLLKKKPIVFLKCSDSLANIIFGKENKIISELARVESIKRVSDHNGLNVIEKNINKDDVVFLEHNMTKEELKKLFEPVLKKEVSLRQRLEMLSNKITQQNIESSSKILYKEFNVVKKKLEDIEEVKKVIENCSRC